MYRSHTWGELRKEHINKEVTLSGWVQKVRDKGFMVWVDVRDRYGITQLIFDEERTPKGVLETAQRLGREFVIQVDGTVIERESKNANIPTANFEIFSDYYEADDRGNILHAIRRHDFEEVKLFDQPAHGACTLFRTKTLILKALNHLNQFSISKLI